MRRRARVRSAPREAARSGCGTCANRSAASADGWSSTSRRGAGTVARLWVPLGTPEETVRRRAAPSSRPGRPTGAAITAPATATRSGDEEAGRHRAEERGFGPGGLPAEHAREHGPASPTPSTIPTLRASARMPEAIPSRCGGAGSQHRARVRRDERAGAEADDGERGDHDRAAASRLRAGRATGRRRRA